MDGRLRSCSQRREAFGGFHLRIELLVDAEVATLRVTDDGEEA